MILGIPREIMPAENRVAVTPAAVREITRQGHRVLVEAGAGDGSGFNDDMFARAGALIIDHVADIWTGSEMVVKVKEPLESEFRHFRRGLTVFAFLHLAADRPLAINLLEGGVTALAYETLQTDDGHLPLLTPMSEIAGRIGAQEAACLMAKHRGGKGKLIGGSAGVPPATVMVLGGGVAGLSAAQVATGMGARVLIYDIDLDRLREIDRHYEHPTTVFAAGQYIEDRLPETDIVLGCVLVPGARAPVLVTREMVRKLSPGSVIVDIAIDQGGCVETSRPTTHLDPTFTEEGVIHYCVANIPGAMPRTSTVALSNATLGYILKIADAKNLMALLKEDPVIGRALNTFDGRITLRPVSEALGLPFETI